MTAKSAANTLTPEEVLRVNGWTPDGTRNYYTYWTKDGICVFWNGDNWGIRQDIERVTRSHFWNPDKGSFPEWLAAEVADLQALKPEQPAAEQENPEPNAIYNNAAKAESAKEAKDKADFEYREQNKMLQNAGWKWDDEDGTYAKKNCAWRVNPLPGHSWIASLKGETTIFQWIIWTPKEKGLFTDFLKEFGN